MRDFLPNYVQQAVTGRWRVNNSADQKHELLTIEEMIRRAESKVGYI